MCFLLLVYRPYSFAPQQHDLGTIFEKRWDVGGVEEAGEDEDLWKEFHLELDSDSLSDEVSISYHSSSDQLIFLSSRYLPLISMHPNDPLPVSSSPLAYLPNQNQN